MANAVVSSGLVTKQCVEGLPSLRAAKLRLYDVTMEFASPDQGPETKGSMGSKAEIDSCSNRDRRSAHGLDCRSSGNVLRTRAMQGVGSVYSAADYIVHSRLGLTSAPFLISVRFHWPMQGPQALASTVPPTLSKISIKPSRSMVARICSLPGVMVKGTYAQR